MKPSMNISRLAVAKLRLASSRRSTIGSSLASSQATKYSTATRLTSAPAVMNDEPNQSSCCPRSSTTWSMPRPSVSSAKPI